MCTRQPFLNSAFLNSYRRFSMSRFLSYALTLSLSLCLASGLRAQEPKTAAGQAGWQSLFDGKSLAGWKVTDFGGEGEVTVEDGQIIMHMGQPLTGITIKAGD